MAQHQPRPVLGWARGYQRGWLPFDVIAGLTVCAILVPEGMAYAGLAGVPPEYAFYAAPAALLAYALLGGSRQLVVAVSSAIAIMSAGTISLLAVAGSAEYIALTAALAMLAGLLSMAAGLLKLGRIAQFFSESVLVGFVFGLALLICIKQLPKLLGVEAHGDSALLLLLDLLPKLAETHALTLAVGGVCIAAMVLLERVLPRVPAALVVLVGSIGMSAALGLASRGVAVVGVLPAGLAGPSLPGVGLDALPLLFAGAAGIALVAFAEAIGPAEQFAREHDAERVDPNRELIAIGAANTGAGLFGGFPIGSSLSKSAANDRAGARSQMSLVVAAAATALVAIFLTPLFEPLPEATLGAIVVVAVSGMMRVGAMRRLWRLRRTDFWLAMTALVGVLVVDTLEALAIAVFASLGVLVWRASEARLTFLGRATIGVEPVDLQVDPGAEVPGLQIVRPDEMLYFANAASVRESVVEAVLRSPARPSVVLLDLSLTPELDVPAADGIGELGTRLAAAGIELWLGDVRPVARDMLERAGVVALLGEARIYPRTVDGILVYVLRAPGGEERARVLADLIAYLDDRRRLPGTGPAGLELLDALEHRLRTEFELARGETGASQAAGEQVVADAPNAEERTAERA